MRQPVIWVAVALLLVGGPAAGRDRAPLVNPDKPEATRAAASTIGRHAT